MPQSCGLLRKEIAMYVSSPNQIATFPNAEYGVASLVTKISKGYAVTLLDTDANEVLPNVTIYPFSMLPQALAYAKNIAGVAA
jgi:hypothetical protein